MSVQLNKRKEIYRGSSSLAQELYGSLELGTLLQEILVNYKIDNKEEFIFTVGDIVLGIHPLDKLSSLLQVRLALSPKVADMISVRIGDFLKPKLEKIYPHNEEVGADKDKTKSNGESTDENKTVKVTQPTTQVGYVKPEEPTEVTPLRTLEKDIKNVHGYGVPSYSGEDSEETHKSEQADVMSPNGSSPKPPQST